MFTTWSEPFVTSTVTTSRPALISIGASAKNRSPGAPTGDSPMIGSGSTMMRGPSSNIGSSVSPRHSVGTPGIE